MIAQVNGAHEKKTDGDAVTPVLRVGIICCGEIAQVVHIPTINFLSTHFQTAYLCDVSEQSLAHCAQKINGGIPRTTTSADELCSSPDVDVVLISNATTFHAPHAILALQNDKYVLVEKPLALCYRDVDAIIAAEKKSKGRVFVGYMRRYATAFLDAVAEVGGMDKIHYARVRDIIGPNEVFVNQSGTFPKRFSDFSKQDSDDLIQRDEEILEQALMQDYRVPVTPESKLMVRILGGLGSHDLSAMREILGMPQCVLGASLGLPVWSVLFKYDSFPVTYESGLNNIPTFDAHIEVYSADKVARVNYDSPYVKGLPTTMTIREKIDGGGYQERLVRKTYEDSYTKEPIEFYDCAVNAKTPKTTAADAREDLDLFRMIMQAGTAKNKGLAMSI